MYNALLFLIHHVLVFFSNIFLGVKTTDLVKRTDTAKKKEKKNIQISIFHLSSCLNMKEQGQDHSTS